MSLMLPLMLLLMIAAFVPSHADDDYVASCPSVSLHRRL